MLWFISDQKARIFVCATTVEQILFLNNRNRKDVGGKHNFPVYTMWMLVHLTHLLLSSATHLYDVFCGSIWLKILLYFLACHKREMNFIPQLQEQKKDIGGTHNVPVHYVDISASSLFNVVLCNPFKWDILWFISNQKSCNFCVPAIKE